MPLGFAAAAVAAVVVGTIGCTASGSSTVISSGGGDSGVDGGSDNPFESDGGTTTTKDSGGTQSTDYEALFGPPASSSTTPDSLLGLWAGTGVNGQDMRIQFAKSSIVVALKCFGDAAIGTSIASSVSSGSIKTLESKKLGNTSSCGLSITPDELSSCTSATYPCFTLNGTKLDLANFFQSSGQLTKLSD